jgi:hypothetical protein
VKCRICHRPIRPGQEADKRIECWRWPDGTEHLFGVGMEAGTLDDVAKQGWLLIWAKHNKCHYIEARREQRGRDGVMGSELAQAALALEDEDD